MPNSIKLPGVMYMWIWYSRRFSLRMPIAPMKGSPNYHRSLPIPDWGCTWYRPFCYTHNTTLGNVLSRQRWEDQLIFRGSYPLLLIIVGTKCTQMTPHQWSISKLMMLILADYTVLCFFFTNKSLLTFRNDSVHNTLIGVPIMHKASNP